MANAELLEELLAWIQWAETTLIQRDQDPMPQNIDQVKALISEHQVSPELSSGEGQGREASPGSLGGGGTDFSWNSLLKQSGTQLEQNQPRDDLQPWQIQVEQQLNHNPQFLVLDAHPTPFQGWKAKNGEIAKSFFLILSVF